MNSEQLRKESERLLRKAAIMDRLPDDETLPVGTVIRILGPFHVAFFKTVTNGWFASGIGWSAKCRTYDEIVETLCNNIAYVEISTEWKGILNDEPGNPGGNRPVEARSVANPDRVQADSTPAFGGFCTPECQANHQDISP